MEHFNTYSAHTKMVKFPESVDPDETAHDELPHLDLHCLSLSSSLECLV